MAKKPEFTFVDLFAGIGGFHLALRNLGAKCIFLNEFDKYAKETYLNYFQKKDPELFNSHSAEYFWKNIRDITLSNTDKTENIKINNIKEIISARPDILCAGFPCQPFSLVGKKNGFDDDRGTLFKDIHLIIRALKPRVIFLENVRHIVQHDNGKVLNYIIDKLGKADYEVNTNRGKNWDILKASDFGLPTYRQRFYFVAFRKDVVDSGKFKFPDPITPGGITLSQFFKDDDCYGKEKYRKTGKYSRRDLSQGFG